jgi:hypothetical protein
MAKNKIFCLQESHKKLNFGLRLLLLSSCVYLRYSEFKFSTVCVFSF